MLLLTQHPQEYFQEVNMETQYKELDSLEDFIQELIGNDIKAIKISQVADQDAAKSSVLTLDGAVTKVNHLFTAVKFNADREPLEVICHKATPRDLHDALKLKKTCDWLEVCLGVDVSQGAYHPDMYDAVKTEAFMKIMQEQQEQEAIRRKLVVQ